MYYPYYIVPDVEAYKLLAPDSEEAKKLARRIVANIGDLASLRLVLGIDPPEFARFYPDMETHTPTTLDTIDSFLDKFGSNLPPTGYIPAEDEASQEEIPQEKNSQSIISPSDSAKEKVSDLGFLIKERRYDEAIQLIERQNLNNPQKSIYFAHQIRFLRKLLAIENYRKPKQG